jgi:hypothetical protein
MFKSKPTFEKLKKEKDAIGLKIDKEITKYMELIMPYQNKTTAIMKFRSDLDTLEDKYEATEEKIFELMKIVNTVLKSWKYNDLVDQHMTTIAMLEEKAAVEEAEFFETLDRLEILDNAHDDLRFTMRAQLDKIKKLVMQKRKINKQMNSLISV